MADTWTKIFRQVALLGNVLITGDAATAEANYINANISPAQLSAKSVEFPFTAVCDAILNAADIVVRLIGLSRNSPYRMFFHGITDALVSGQIIPAVDDAGKARVGIIGAVIDVNELTKKCKLVDYSKVENFDKMTLPIIPYWYATDNIRIWHTRPEAVLADVVVWQKTDQRAAMEAVPMGNCPFPDDLDEALVSGALCYMFRNNFNKEQLNDWKDTFRNSLSLISQDWESKLGQLDILE